MTDSVEHAANLLIATFMKNDLEPRVFIARAQLLNLRWLGAFPFSNGDTTTQALNRVVRRQALHLNLINLGDAILRRGYDVSKVPVIRQQQQPFTIEVESPNRIQPAESRRNQLRHQRPAFGIGHAAQITTRLVEEDVEFFLMFYERIYQAPLNFDVIAGWISLGPKLSYDFSVDADLPRQNHFFCMTARGDAGCGD